MTALTATPRIRFNWGYHDGAADVKHNRPNKWTIASYFSNEYRQGYLAVSNEYCQGYLAGFNAATRVEGTDSSDGAWFDALAWGDV